MFKFPNVVQGSRRILCGSIGIRPRSLTYDSVSRRSIHSSSTSSSDKSDGEETNEDHRNSECYEEHCYGGDQIGAQFFTSLGWSALAVAGFHASGLLNNRRHPYGEPGVGFLSAVLPQQIGTATPWSFFTRLKNRLTSSVSVPVASTSGVSLEKEINEVNRELGLLDSSVADLQSSLSSSESSGRSCVKTIPSSSPRKHEASVQTDANDWFADEMKSTVTQFESNLLNVTGLEFLRKRMYKEAFEHFKSASALGYAKAQYNLGMCYFKGYGCSKELTKAAECWNNAAKQGHGNALYQLGVLADRESNLSLCKDFMLRAASQNVPEAQKYVEEKSRASILTASQHLSACTNISELENLPSTSGNVTFYIMT